MKAKVLVKIKSYEINKEYLTNGILNKKDNILIYSDDDKTINKLDFKNQLLMRSNDNYEIKMFFSVEKESHCDIYLKKYSKNVNNIIIVNKLINKDNYFEVCYVINGNEKVSYIVEIIK